MALVFIHTFLILTCIYGQMLGITQIHIQEAAGEIKLKIVVFVGIKQMRYKMLIKMLLGI